MYPQYPGTEIGLENAIQRGSKLMQRLASYFLTFFLLKRGLAIETSEIFNRF
jgi:hypothetical protein